MKLIYVASPYSYNATSDSKEDRDTRVKRMIQVNKYVTDHTVKNSELNNDVITEMYYSPISYYTNVLNGVKFSPTFNTFEDVDLGMIDKCDKMVVLYFGDEMESTDNSEGVQNEIRYAEKIGKEITYVHMLV